jgi:hypothetical protein
VKGCSPLGFGRAGEAVRSASPGGVTRVRRCGFGRARGLGERRSGRHLPPRQGTAPWVRGPRFMGSQGTTRRPNSQKVRWSKWMPQPTPFPGIGDGRGFMVVSSCRFRHAASAALIEAAGSPRAASLRWPSAGQHRTSVRGGSTRRPVQATPRPARGNDRARVLSLRPEKGHGPGETRVGRDTMAGVVRSGDRAIDGWPGRSGARPARRHSSEGAANRLMCERGGCKPAQAHRVGSAVPRKHRDAPACTG